MSGVSLPPGMTPDMMKQASSMLSSMAPDDFDRLAAQAGSGSFPPQAPSAAASPPAATPEHPSRGPAASAAPATAAARSAEQMVSPVAAAGTSAAGPLSLDGGGLQQAASMMQVNSGESLS